MPGPPSQLGKRRIVIGYAVGTLGALVMAGLLSALPAAGLPVQTLLMLVVVIASALIGGLRPAIVAALFSALTLNFAFVAPTGSLLITDPLAGVALIVFVVVGLAVATVVDRSARLAAQAVRARTEADALADLAERLLRTADDPAEVLDQAMATLGVGGAAIWRADGDRTEVEAAVGDAPRPTTPSAAATIEDGVRLVLAGPPLAADQQALFTAYAAHLRVVRERRRAAEQDRQTAQLTESNRIRTALLAAVSHDLRSPLAAIKAAVTSLRSDDVVWSADDEAELLATIDEGADRLERLVTNLLDLSRLQTGAVGVFADDLDLAALVSEALRGLDSRDRVDQDLPAGLSVRADPGLAERVIANLVDNALRYAPDSRVLISAQGGDEVTLRIVDHGPGVAVAERGRLFQPFQRLGDAPREGTGLGLGLAVALGLTEAMGGRLAAQDSPDGGLTMVLSLPAAGAEVNR